MKKERIFWGVFLILGAIFILVSRMGMFMEGISVWTMIWAVFFAALFIKSLVSLKFPGIFFSAALLGIIFAEPLQIQDITPWPLLGAALLLSIGFSLLFPKKKWKKGDWSCKVNNANKHFLEEGEETESVSNGSVCFGSSIRYVKSTAFVNGSFECSFGSMTVYFENATMKEATAGVRVENSFGAMTLYVPKEWSVVNQVESAFGGIKMVGVPCPDNIHTLVLSGENSFGNVTVNFI